MKPSDIPGLAPSQGSATPPDPRRSSAINLGFNFAAGMIVLTYLGHWIDGKRGGGRGWTLAGILLGLVYGAYEVWKVVRNPGDNGTPPTSAGRPKP